MKRVYIATKNEYLRRKIALTLDGIFDITLVSVGEEYDACFWDIDSMGEAPEKDGFITVSRTLPCALKMPAAFEDIIRCVSSAITPAPISLNGRICHLRGESIRLTELEAALLARLISAKGEFVSRAEILHDVWGDGADEGIINVYIHYLREKLERGEKIILSSRRSGYKIDGRYLYREEAENA
ncbi:MAG: helix-turn-helix domain-containing protein [Clostridia bacterium]|nr:helix-turn-helix domain-containing protein [Clostridia bacterium]